MSQNWWSTVNMCADNLKVITRRIEIECVTCKSIEPIEMENETITQSVKKIAEQKIKI